MKVPRASEESKLIHKYDDSVWRRDTGPWQAEALAKTPWIEVAVSVFVGIALLFLGKTELAQVSWILGVALSLTRNAFVKKLEEEMTPVHRLAAIIDLQRQLSVKQFQEMLRMYLEITETEFGRVKDVIITETIEKLEKLARQKRSEELATGEYFNWLFSTLRGTTSGSEIWAVSMMLSIEWRESEVEQTFLDLNLAAAERGVYVERIFVVRRTDIPLLLSNKYIKAQYDNAGTYLKPLVVEREYLEQHDPSLLKHLGDGLIAVDDRVALIDISSPEGYRGQVTMNSGDIAKLRRWYENLSVNARPLKQAIQALPNITGTKTPSISDARQVLNAAPEPAARPALSSNVHLQIETPKPLNSEIKAESRDEESG